MAKKWFNGISPLKSLRALRAPNETKALAEKLDAVLGEYHDQMDSEAKFFDSEGGGSAGGFTEMTGIDQIVNPVVMTKIYSSETWVYVAVNAVAQTIAGLPIKLEKRRTVQHVMENEVTGEKESVTQEIWTDASGEKLAARFQYPNPHCSKTEFYTLLLIDLLTTGQYFIWLDSDADLTTLDYSSTEDAGSPFGRLRQLMASNTPIKAMYRIPPALMRAVPSETAFGIDAYELNSDRGTFAFNPAEIVHVKLPNPQDPNTGLSPLIPAFKPVLIDRFSTEHMIRFYKSGARLGGVIQTDKTLNKEQLGRFQRSFENNYTGRQNHHRTLILPPGMKYEAIEENPAQLALLDFCKYNREAVLAAYRVPPIKAGILDGSNYANARAQLRTFFKDTIIPMLGFVQDGFNLKTTLMPVGTYRMQFDLSMVEELQDDGVALGAVAKAMLDSGVMVNEVRKKVWKLGPIPDGNQAPVIAKIERDMMQANAQASHAGTGPTAPGTSPEATGPTAAEGATANQQAIEANQVTDPTLSLNGAQVTALIAVISEVAQGLLPRASGVEIIIASFSVDRDAAERIMGEVGKTFVPKLPSVAAEVQPTPPAAPITAAAPAAEAHGEPAKTPCACPEGTENCNCDEDPTDPDDNGAPPAAPKSDGSAPSESSPPPADTAKSEGPVSLEQFISTSLAAMGEVPATPELITMLLAQFESSVGAKTPSPTVNHPLVMTKDQLNSERKTFVDKTEPLVALRALNVRAYLEKCKAVIMSRLGANVKAYGLVKARNENDIDEILGADDEFDALGKAYSADVDQVLIDAFKDGFASTLIEFKMGGKEDAEVADVIRKYLADKIKGINDTTLDQIRTILADKFEAGAAIGEISKALQEKFVEMSTGRAVTIARTETLTAVSIGREQKRQEVRAEFPDAKFVKTWVSAGDDAVRDSHEALDGVTIDADETFDNGLLYPRDPAGDAKEVINCRCTDITSVAGSQDLVDEQINEDADQTEPDGKTAWVCAAGIAEHKGGPGSGCQGANCGRPPGNGSSPDGAAPAGGLSPDTQKLIGRGGQGEGRAVELNRDQITEVLDKGTYALVSAGKNIKDAEDNALSDEQVKARYDQLEADLKASGYAYTRVAGHYGAKEDTFLVQVHEADRSEMIKLGEKYKQDSIIYTKDKQNEMIYTTGPDKGKKQSGEGYTWQDNADDYYTVITHPDGAKSKFQLNFNFDDAPKSFEKTPCEECKWPHAENCDCDEKGGPGSGCHGPNCGRPSGEITEHDGAPILVHGNRERDREIDDTPIRVGESLRKPKPKLAH